ncbi:MAG: sulfatase-like hydrolase/transferase [Verrucomicrobiae bacterium]|nr:sulfatase-like hydrolase/transferase [Verrucomicrobiae bacterium]
MNILQIVSDQHIARCLGSAGHPQVLTPHLDRLAREGVRFTDAYTQNPICTPSRVSLLSGQYCHNHGFYGLSGPSPIHLPSLLSHFRAHGYRTAGIGKLHMPNLPRDWIYPHCDLYAECYEYGPTAEKSPYYASLEALGLREKEDSILLPEFPGSHHHDARPSLLPYEHSVEGWSVAQAIRFMEECGSRPFCMQVSFPRPHQAFTPDRQFWDMYPENLATPPTLHQDPSGRPPHFQEMYQWYHGTPGLIEPRDFESWSRRVWRGYLACITQVDHSVGLLLGFLDRSGRASDTLVVYQTDHGGYHGVHGLPEKAPGICSDSVCRVPMIWRVPGIPPGVCRQLAENIDMVSTVTTLCGVPALETTDGKDLTPLLRGSDRPVREVAVTENPWSKSIRWDQWRYVHYPPPVFGRETGELYDVEKDPDENRNLFEDHPGEVREGRKRLLNWLIQTTRVKTIWPTLTNDDWDRPQYRTAADGTLANGHGPAEQANHPEMWMKNYL